MERGEGRVGQDIPPGGGWLMAEADDSGAAVVYYLCYAPPR